MVVARPTLAAYRLCRLAPLEAGRFAKRIILRGRNLLSVQEGYLNRLHALSS